MEKYLLSCDWGTTFFRLRLIEMPGEYIVNEVSSEDGVTRTFTAWKNHAADKGITRKQYFLDQLKKQTDILAGKTGIKLDGLTILISGMASSTIGMQEMPYAPLPFAIDGSKASVQYFDIQEGFPNKVILISGARSNEDVMRGEETQLVGAAKLLELQQQEAVLILPGTHSKHLHVKDGQLINIQTFMTGELFSLLTNHSILKDSVETTDVTEFSESDIEAFKAGIKKSQEFNVLNSLFTVRTNQLFNKFSKKQNWLYLSALLIGTELNHLTKKENTPLILCSGNNLHGLYKLALQELGLLQRTTLFSADKMIQATIAGQVTIFQNNIVTA
jgi:2-dehydro-3-deoxygalactonokinase